MNAATVLATIEDYKRAQTDLEFARLAFQATMAEYLKTRTRRTGAVKELARAVQTSEGVIYNYKLSRAPISTERAEQIIRALGDYPERR